MKKIAYRLGGTDPAIGDPNIFEGFIGQESAIKKLKFYSQSHTDNTPFPTLLFTGSHGLGKTFLAEKTAKSLGREFLTINCGSMKTKEELVNEVFFSITKPTTLFFDESHRLSKELTTMLLTLLNPTASYQNVINYNNFEFQYDMRKLNMVFATTDAYMMFSPLRNRCSKIYFDTYSNDELIRILQFYLPDTTFSCDLNDIADACRSRARDAFLLSQNIKRYSVLSKSNEVTEDGWKEIKNTFGIFPKGLNSEEFNLLKAVSSNGPISSGNLALLLMVNKENIEEELEVRLRELGMIKSTTKGRLLTEFGKEYLNQLA